MQVLRAHCPQLFIHSPRVQRVSPSLSHTFTPEGARNATTQDTLSIPAADTKSIRVEDKLKHLRAHMALQIKIPVPEEYRIHVLTWYLEVLCSKSICVPLHIQGQRREANTQATPHPLTHFQRCECCTNNKQGVCFEEGSRVYPGLQCCSHQIESLTETHNKHYTNLPSHVMERI